MKRSLLVTMLLGVLLATAGAQPKKASAREIARLEQKVQTLEATYGQQLAALRKLYRSLRERFEHPSPQERERIIAEMARVIEPVLTKARQTSGGKRAKQRKVADLLNKMLPDAVSAIEIPELLAVRSFLLERLLAVAHESNNVADVLALEPKDWAGRALAPLLDTEKEFHDRWNLLLADRLPEAESFRSAYALLEKARQDLMVARDPLLLYQIDAPEGFARVPAGSYVMLNTAGFGGSGIRKGKKKFKLSRPVLIGLYEVTNREYHAWIKSFGDKEEANRHLPRDATGRKILWPRDEASGEWAPTEEMMDLPVVGVRLTSAMAYAQWRGARLPTEREWCACASGPEGLLYPWGSKWEEGRCNSREAGIGAPSPVGSFPEGRGVFGHYDLAGNAMEWTITSEAGKLITPQKISDDLMAVVRGGSFEHSKTDVSTGWVWFKRARYGQEATLGFRLAMDDTRGAGRR